MHRAVCHSVRQRTALNVTNPIPRRREPRARPDVGRTNVIDQIPRPQRALRVRLSPRILVTLLRQRLREAPKLPPRTLVRRHWAGLTALACTLAAVFAVDSWLYTCGYAGCPSATEIRAFHPSEGGRIVDQYGRLIGRLA